MSQSPSNLRIGVIGAGNIGQPLARLFTKAGHTVKIATAKGPDALKEIAQHTGATAATVQDAVKDAQLVVVTIPQEKVQDLDKSLFSSLPADTIVIDTGNYYPFRDGRIEELESGIESRWVEKQLGHAVVKVFNNILAHSLNTVGKPAGTPGRVALPVAGDNASHRATVIALLDQIGFDGVDAGGLDESWRQQPGTPVYCLDLDAAGVKRALSRADRSRSHAVRDASIARAMPVYISGEQHKALEIVRTVAAEQYGE